MRRVSTMRDTVLPVAIVAFCGALLVFVGQWNHRFAGILRKDGSGLAVIAAGIVLGPLMDVQRARSGVLWPDADQPMPQVLSGQEYLAEGVSMFHGARLLKRHAD